MQRVRAVLAALLERHLTAVALVALNAPLVALVLLRDLGEADRGWLTVAYTAGAIVGWYLLPALLVCAVVTLLLAAWRRLAAGACVVLLSLYVFYLLLDSFVFAIYKFHIDFFWLDFLIHDFQGLGIPATMVLLAAGTLVVILLVERGLLALAVRWRRRRLLTVGFPLVAVLGLVLSQVIHVVAYEKEDVRITRVTPMLPFYMPLRSHKHAVKYGDRLGMIAQGDELARRGEGQGVIRYPLATITRDSIPRDRLPNIVMILLESWRADTMNDEVSPRIAALGRRSTVCLNHFSTGNSTVAGVFGLFYGLYPTYWEAVKASAVQIDNPLLIDILREEGYDFGIFARSHFKRHKIEDTIFRGIPIHEKFAGRSADQWDRDLTDQMLAFLDRHRDGRRPFFLFGFYKASHFNYNYDEAHARFRPSRKLNIALVGKKKDPQLYLNDYRNAVLFDDDQVGRLLDRLEALGMMDNTIIIVTTDHAEEFDDDGANYWGHGSNFTRWQTQVPLVLYLPDRPPRRITARTSHLDLPPTLLREYFGVRNDVRDYSDGLDLLGEVPPLRPLVVSSYFNHAFVIGDDVYVVLPLGTKKHRLDDITAPAGRPRMDLLQTIMRDISRFYDAGASGRPPAPGPAVAPAPGAY